MEDIIIILVIVYLVSVVVAGIYIIKLKNGSQNYFEALKRNHQYIESYQAMVKRNFRKMFSSGESVLIERFKELLRMPGHESWKIYGHLNLKNRNIFKNYQADFLIVCDRGIFVIESKFWKGLTLIYSKGKSGIFENSQFYDYGRDFQTDYKVYNISRKSNGDILEINKYTNPIPQVRNYSRILRNRLNMRVHNFVVFQKDYDCQVKINDKDLEYYKVDDYTGILTQESLIPTLLRLEVRTDFDPNGINFLIQSQFEYEILLTSDNIDQPPWGGE